NVDGVTRTKPSEDRCQEADRIAQREITGHAMELDPSLGHDLRAVRAHEPLAVRKPLFARLIALERHAGTGRQSVNIGQDEADTGRIGRAIWSLDQRAMGLRCKLETCP